VATGKQREVRAQLRVLFGVGTYANLTDGQLLERFATDRGEAGELALAALIERHGPMVLRVCRGVLADPHDVEDAFQATFLVLIRKARGLWVRESLGPWLHQVAARTARGARSAAARRRHDRLAASARPEVHVMRDDEPVRIVHEEIERLPERYRAPVVLCDLEGRTNEQAARHLGWPVGTVKSRLARARQRLRDRLIRRGLDPGAAVLSLPAIGERLGTRVPAALADATVRAAARFAVPNAILPGTAALLAHGVLRAMILTQCLKAAAILLALGAVVPGAVLLSQGAPGDDLPKGEAAAAQPDTPPGIEVKPGPLRVEVQSRGLLEPVQGADVVNEVEEPTTIVAIKPEGARVTKGEVVVELDSAALRDQLVNQEIAAKRAEGEREVAAIAVEAAHSELQAFERVVFPLREEAIADRIAVAEAEVALARRRVERVEHGPDADDLATAEARLAVMRAEGALRTAKGERLLLREGTRATELGRLHAADAAARSLMFDRDCAYRLEEAKREKLVKQIERCKVLAPGEGIVLHADSVQDSAFRPLGKGVTVTRRQRLFRVFDPTQPMRVKAKVQEAVIDQVRPGQRARVTVQAFPDRVLSGTVKAVAPEPDADGLIANPPRKVYTTLVELDEPDAKFRPGMVASVRIVVAELKDVLTVPVSAVLFNSNDVPSQVAVMKPDGGYAWRELTLGRSDGRRVEIKAGLAAGERVAPDAASALRSGGAEPVSALRSGGGARPEPAGEPAPPSP
jgi:RNA polymerase sigma factor (sigma-70 family)